MAARGARTEAGWRWRIGYLSATETPGEPQAQSRRLIMETALAQLGYIEGKNLVIERRLLSDQVEQVKEVAAELVALHPDAKALLDLVEMRRGPPA
jgi:hypothetical protein